MTAIDRTVARGAETAPPLLPVMLRLAGEPCLVVGAGAVAGRKVAALLEAGARVTVVAPRVSAGIAGLAAHGRVALERRAFRAGDTRGMRVVFAAAGRGEVSARVAADARRSGALVNAVDDPAHCAFFSAAHVRRGLLTVAVSTAGASPGLAARLRDALERILPDSTTAVLAQLARARDRLRREERDPGRRRRALRELADRAFATLAGQLARRLRAHAAWSGRRPVDPPPADRARPAAPSSRRGGPGGVALVGAGPGDPGLLTLRGRELLRAADVVLLDRLVGEGVERLIPAGVERLAVGKTPGAPSMHQRQIERLMVDRALRGQRVVRLKGGDPFIFGRGGEEVAALVRAGIPVEAVPGVSAVGAVPAGAGIPLTHRGVASGFVVISGERGRDSVGGTGLVSGAARESLARSAPRRDRVDPAPAAGAALAAHRLDDPPVDRTDARTVVVLMCMRRLEKITAELVASGRPPTTPAAVVVDGTLPSQRVVRGTLASIARQVRIEELGPPGVLVVGEVVRLAAALGQLEGRVPRDELQAAAAGGEPPRMAPA